MKPYFITATGTEIGKTALTSTLCWQLRKKGRDVFAIKPVISGFEDGDLENDTCQIAKALGRSCHEETIRRVSPFRFTAPLSPNLAAAREGKAIIPEEVLEFCDKTIREHDITLIEGIGGTHVPIAEDFLVADWILDLGIPAVLVTGSYLGALSHTLVSVEALQAMGIEIASIVVSQSEEEPMPFKETVRALMEELPDQNIFAFPRVSKTPVYEHAPDMTKVLV